MPLTVKKKKKNIQHKKIPFKKVKDGEHNRKDAGVSETHVSKDYINEEDNKKELGKYQSGLMRRKHEPNNDAYFEPQKKRNKHADTTLLKPLTVKELNRLRETENLFHSKLFRLQIQEMLKEIKIKPKHKTDFNQHWLSKLKNTLENIKDSKVYDISSPKLLEELKVIPLKQTNKATGSFQFIKPADVGVVGSFSVGCCLGPTARIDVRVEMPKECFLRDDYLNYRYQWKRALYLAYLAQKLQKCDFVEHINFAYDRGNPLKPVLEMKARGTLCNHVIVMHVSASQDMFKLQRFSPSKSNAQPHWYFGEEKPKQGELPPTPHLNNTVLEDLTMNMNQNYVKRVLEKHTNLRDGIKLLKVWLHQRGLDQGYGSFGGHVMTMYVLHLLKSQRLNKLMSSYQVVRNTWNNLGQCDLIKNGITLAESSETLPPLSEFHQHFEVVFIDVSGFCNLCANMTQETFLKIKYESEMAVKCLDNPNINSFQALFMTMMPFYRQYDHLIRIEDGATIKKMVEEHSPRKTQLDYAGHMFPQALNLVLGLLRQGLGKRISSLAVQLPASARWSVDSEPPAGSEPILLGLTLNPEYAFNVLDKGPPANSLEAVEFRTFWGDRSELRRFQDGSISEVVVWPGEQTLARKRVVCRQIVTYLLNSRLGISHLVYVANELESLLHQTKLKPAGFEYGTGEEAVLSVLSSFDGLARQLRQLDDLPLNISAVQGSSAVFRYTEVFPPLATNHRAGKKLTREDANCLLLRDGRTIKMAPRWIPPIEAVIQLGMSGKWPNDLDAVQRLRVAFNIDIAKGLRKRFNLTTHPYTNYIDVLKDGFVFRIYVACDREIALLKQSTTPQGLVVYRDTEESLTMERNIFHKPKLTSALHGLHQQHPSLGPACCLAKRWLSSHYMDPHHFPEMCVELLMASLYLTPHPFQPPNQPQLGLFRFLNLLGHTDWNAVPIILNFNAEMERDEIVEIETKFQSSRSSLPSLYIVTPYDREHSIWTKTAPTLQILIRVAKQAEIALKVLEDQLFTGQMHSKKIFRPQLVVYDVLITLQLLLNPRRHEAVDEDTNAPAVEEVQPYKHHPGEKIPVVGFNPISLFLAELRANFGDFALFFHDCYGGDIIGVLWKPSATEAMDFKVSHVNCRKLDDTDKLILDIDATIKDFYILGDGLVRSIIQKTESLDLDLDLDLDVYE